MSSLSSWTPKDASRFQITWSTGYVRYRVFLSGSGGSFCGTAHYFEDTGTVSSESFVTVHRIECGSSEN